MLARNSSTRDADSDDDGDLDCPIFDCFYNADENNGIAKMIIFTAVEFRDLYARLQGHIVTGRDARIFCA